MVVAQPQLVRAGELLMGSYEAYDTDGHVAEAVGLYERCVGPCPISTVSSPTSSGSAA